MKTMIARAITSLSLVFAMNLSLAAATNTPPLVAVDGADGSGSFGPTGKLITARNNHTATLLANGQVLVTGGFGVSEVLKSAELYDPATGEWTATGNLLNARYSHTATLLGDGKVLVTGGHGDSEPLDSAEIYDPATGKWAATGSLGMARYFHTATRLGTGKVLVAAGYNYLAGDGLDTAEIYDPSTGQWTTTGDLADARYVHTATLLGNGQVLAAGGFGAIDYLASAEVFDPETGRWTATGNLTDARYLHTATLLGNGKVLVAGGYGTDFYLNSAELYDSAEGQWVGTDHLAESRYSHAATRLADGEVLVTGGFANSGTLNNGQLYQPASGGWISAAPIATARYNHTATLLSDGKVLVAGGTGDGPLDSVELYSVPPPPPATPEGSPAMRAGTFSDAEGNPSVTLTTSSGAVVADPNAGTWSWSATPPDGPTSTFVTITATDSLGVSAVVGFTFTVANVPPMASITAPVTANEDAAVDFSFTAADPGSIDQTAGFSWTIDYGDGSGMATLPAGTASPLAASHSFASPGDYVVTMRATDKDGGVSGMASNSISIADVTPPVIASHVDVGPVEATGPGGAIVNYAPASATDNSGAPVTDITYSQDSGTGFAIGTTLVTITATDAAGNFNTATFQISVVDSTAPLAEAPAGGFDPVVVNTGSLPDYTSQLIASDLVGVTLVTQSPPPGTTSGLGAVAVSLVASDAAGNDSLPVTFEVTVAGSGLMNGGFEAGYDGWTVTGNQSVQSTPPYAATEGTRLVAFNDGNRAPGGVLSQTFPTAPGESYQLDFDFGVLAYNASQQKLGVELNGGSNLFSQTYTLASSGVPIRWEGRSLRFMADSTATTLVFRDLSAATVSLDLLLDNVRLTPLATRILTIASSPDVGAAITVSPPDNDAQANGVSNFTRRYLDGTTVNLTAPPANRGFRFRKWLRNGTDLTSSPVVSVVMDSSITLTAVYVDSPPVITTQPVGGAVALGGSKTLGVIAEGTGTLFYQWRLAGGDILGATDSTYTITAMQPSDVGDYDVVVSNSIGPVTSKVASVTLVTTTLINGSFEAGYAGWNFSGNQSIEESAPYVATDGGRLVAFNGTNRAPNGVLEQTFATTPGRSYTLSFDAGVLSYSAQNQSLRVTVTGMGNVLSQTVDLAGSLTQQLRWLPQSFTFVANSVTSTLAFADRSVATNNLDLLLDHVRVTEGTVVPNTAPVAGNDSYMTTLNSPLVVPAPGVITNDSDADSSPLTASILALPQHGDVTFNPNGGFIYTPAGGYTGPDSFTYRVNDGELDSNIAMVSLKVNPPSTQLLFNGSFESGYTGWVAAGNQFIQSSAPYVPTEGSKLASFNAGNRTPDGELSQSFATMAGQTYTLAFDLGVLAYNTSAQTVQVTVTGVGPLLSRTVTITGPGDGSNRWLPQGFTFVANSSVSTLVFRDRSGSTNAIDLMLDNVRVTGVASLAAALPVHEIQLGMAAAELVVSPPIQEMETPILTGTPGDFTIRMTATLEGTYFLERSGDLLKWESAAEKSIAGPGFLEFHDATPPSGGPRFYRIGRRTIGP